MSDELKIDTPEKAAWAMRRYRILAQRRAQLEALAEAERRRIEEWLTRVAEPVQGSMEFYAAHLEAWAMSERAKGRKTSDLPDGKIGTRQTSNSVDVDKSVFVEWAQEADRLDMLRISYAPDMTAIKNAVVTNGLDVIDPITGEVIPGLSPVPERVTVKIEPDMNAIDLEGIEEDDVE
jgi:uncharacterized protein (DUF3084 family)